MQKKLRFDPLHLGRIGEQLKQVGEEGLFDQVRRTWIFARATLSPGRSRQEVLIL